MKFTSKRFHFAVALFPFAVIGVVGLVQLPTKLINDFSVKALFATVFCLLMIRLWLTECRKFSKHPAISVTSRVLSFDDCHVDWAEIRSIKVVTRTLNQHVAIEIGKDQLKEHKEGFWFPTEIYLAAYQSKFELLRVLKECFESSRPEVKLVIPSSSTALFASWFVALCGSIIFLTVLICAIFFIASWLYAVI